MNASQDAPFAVETELLTKVYGSGNTEVVAMKDATMKVRQGEVVALLGSSGSGKSTFLTAVGLINPPTSGRVIIRGQRVLDGQVAKTNLRTYRRQHIGFIFQKSNLIPFLSAEENVRIAMELNGDSRRAAAKRSIELLDYLGVADRAKNLPSMLQRGNNRESPSHEHWQIAPASFSPTNRPLLWTTIEVGKSWNSSPKSPMSSGRESSL